MNTKVLTQKLKQKIQLGFMLMMAVTLLVACGSGGGGSEPGDPAAGDPVDPAGVELNGVFKDSNVIGVDYSTSSGITGTTNALGEFRYRSGDVVTFTIGGVEIGSGTGSAAILPVDMVVDGTTDDAAVIGRVRFMMLLDEDGDPENGISISSGVRSLATGWTQPDFNSGDLDSEMASIISDVVSAQPGAALPSIVDAKNHLESTIACVRAGAYKGSYQGDDNGSFGLLVNALNGDVTGVAYSNNYDDDYELDATNPIEYSQKSHFVSTSASGAAFSGFFPNANSVSGTWVGGSEGGSFSGQRIGGLSNADYRFTGSFTGDDKGLFSFDVSESGTVKGVGYSILEDELLTLTGSVSGTALSVTFPGGGSVSGTLDRNSGALSGTWSDGDVFNGTFSGSGCRLN